MFFSDPWLSAYRCSLRPRFGTIYILLLLLLHSLISVDSRSFHHEIEVRSPDIDPYWYVGRGVRPIGRFGKRHLKNMTNLQPQLSTIIAMILKHLKKHERLDLEKVFEAKNW
ncbi:prolactin-releasing peptide [Pelobates cultripes]|uniref:Prolactin-releasing peptide n=1 Tax=Pelobates cultripes TaxID=61616 RepID=A0AAD1RZB6_PELCU|nr:prolactin-releasing peptide [Pelobates cultripes]